MDQKLIHGFREKLRIIGYAINKIDQVTDHIAEQRFNFEYFRRHPEAGIRGEDVVASPEKAKMIIDEARAERDRFVAVVLYYTGADDEDKAREMYLEKLAVYQRFAKLREQRAMEEVGFTWTEMETPWGGEGELSDELTKAYDTLVSADEGLQIPEPSMIALA